MQYVLWTFVSLVAYVLGIFLLVWSMPRLIHYAYDQLSFTGFAALEIVGALCAFGAVTFTFAIFSGSFGIRLLDFLLLAGIVIVGIILLYRIFHTRRIGVIPISRFVAGIYFLLLTIAALYYITQLIVG